MSGPELVLVLRYRTAVTYGFHVLLGALLGQHETATRYDVRFGESVEETAQHIREAGDVRTLVLWPFYSPDAAALAEELALFVRTCFGTSNRTSLGSTPPRTKTIWPHLWPAGSSLWCAVGQEPLVPKEVRPVGPTLVLRNNHGCANARVQRASSGSGHSRALPVEIWV
ncbi:hypothetical protein [Actinoplanes derwentensis]|uniref:Uncharacterized protein n=1 Tax=Actinoplanes derwentensis TaxID=113562 RepID=A0A1H1T6C1_9ACTN|nr:hypothetical protein [Actinoplanes derwentensis]GID88995.1 hypothetical protein Ade03nite_79190 [Actinoplanes derwentensis]SDS55711.1 hypothetical protein SAMN04489716_1049 [Actinoplanes derwentensis]